MLLWIDTSRFTTDMSAIVAAILDFAKKLFCAKLQQIFLKLVENMRLQP